MKTLRVVSASVATVVLVVAFVAVLADLALSLGYGSTDRDMTTLRFTNQTPSRISIWVSHVNATFELSSRDGIEPGATAIYRDDLFPGAVCSESGYIAAKEPQGREVARTSGPICPNDRWVLDAGGFHRETR